MLLCIVLVYGHVTHCSALVPAGMSGYMEKPYDASKLRDVLTRLQHEAHKTSCNSKRHWVGRL